MNGLNCMNAIRHRAPLFVLALAATAFGGDVEQTWWSLRPVTRHAVPAVQDRGWSRSPIDRFVLSRLELAGWRPSAEAGRRTLIRRATFDLLGLPPTPAATERFVSDPSPDAWSRLIERLLANPHYGERWGRHWLDVARYADNKGYVFFEDKKFPWAWTYRDYVVEAFNGDLSYDRFLLEQIAADLLPLQDTPRARAAMGFLTLGGRFMNNLHDMLDDQIDVVTRGLMGLTVTCARCHDHKYDPIPQADYYSLYGVFRSSGEPLVPPLLSPAPDTAIYRKYATELEIRTGKLRDFIVKAHGDLLVAARVRADEYLLTAQLTLDQPPTDDFMLLTEAGGLNPTLVLRWRVFLESVLERDGPPDPVWAAWQALATLDEAVFARQAPATLQRLARGLTLNRLILKGLQDNPPRSLAETAKTYGRVLNDTEAVWQKQLEQARRTKRQPPRRFEDPAREELRLVFHAPDAPANVPRSFGWGSLALLPDRPAQDTYKKLRKALEKWLVEGKGAPPRAMVLEEHPVSYQPRIFQRGNAARLGEGVPRQLPAAVAGRNRRPFAVGSGRLELARAIASRDNPLTARVLVNRVWMHHFGRGLVRTPSDFGLRGDPPTHRELLDYLAAWFVEEADWSIKSLHRLMMHSAAYRQQSAHRSVPFASDADNRLLWRMQRRRLSFEAMRDSQLVLAGSLDRRLGGPPLPMFTAGGFHSRRSIYGFIDRMNPPPLLRTFDVPNPLTSCGRRTETTVAPQALHLMNHATVHECAVRLLARTSGDVAGRTRQLYLLVYGRPPTSEDLAVTGRFLARGGANNNAAWTALAHALLMSNEAQFID